MAKAYIHPGHGGRDPGALGNGMQEKDINLDVALRLETILLAAGCMVRMSRRTDVLVSNATIINDCNHWGADCYIDLHANAFTTDAANGYETFTPVGKPSTFARAIHAAYMQAMTIRDRGVKSAAELAAGARQRLDGVDCPACLAEMAFITANPRTFTDVPILRDSRAAMAQAFAAGILKFLNVAPASVPQLTAADVNHNYRPSEWAAAAWSWATAEGLTDGSRPRDQITREEMATILYRYDQNI